MATQELIQKSAVSAGFTSESSWPKSSFVYSVSELKKREDHPAVQVNFKRQEIKYLLTFDQFAKVQAAMQGHMVGDEWGNTTIYNLYFDTTTGLLARRSAEHPIYKEKIRLRSYGSYAANKPVYLELKKKFEGITYKRRCSFELERAERFLAGKGDPHTQIERELDFAIRRHGKLLPAALIMYGREAFYAKDDHEFRITFDRDIRARTTELDLRADTYGIPLLDENKVLMEVKCLGAMPLWLVELLSSEAIFKAHFSKYGRAWEELLEPRIAWSELIAS